MGNDIKRVTCEHLLKLRKDDLEHIILDIRDQADFETGHIAGSIHIPNKELATNVENLIPDKGGRVIVVVGPTHEPEVEEIQAELNRLGYGKVEFLSGGIDRWCEIAPMEVEPELTDLTPEESGFVGDDLSHIDPEEQEGEPPM
jgi:rhodanese-related sulfurtransferase